MSAPPAEMSVRRKHSLPTHAVVALVLLVLAGVRGLGPSMSRPFEVDELLTTSYYTWVGLRPDGEVRTLGHIDEFYALPRPGLRHLGMGVYCAAGRWPEPNNHIPNSLLVSAALVLQRSEWAARLPALLCAVVFAFGLYWLCGPVLGWRAAAPLVALWAWFAPYVAAYSQTARGYSAMLALQVLLLLAAHGLARRPSSLVRGALCAALAALAFLNVVSLALDWLVPFYLALFLYPPLPDTDRAAWRRNLAAQVLAVGAVGLLFLVSHLPMIYSSSQQYGLPFASVSEFFDLLAQIFDRLFPGLEWKLFAALAGAGLVLLCASRQSPFLAALVILTGGVSLGHFVLARHLPYERGMGYLLPLVLLGAAYLVERIVQALDSLAARALVWTACAGLTVLLVPPSLRFPTKDDRLELSLELARKLEPAPGARTYLLFGYGFDFITGMYRPRDWDCVDVLRPGMELRILAFIRYHPSSTFNVGVRAGPQIVTWRLMEWETTNHAAAMPYDMVEITGVTQPLTGDTAAPAKALLFWYPDAARLGVSGRAHTDYIDASGLKYLPRLTRYQAKLDVYVNLECLVLIAETPAEYRKAAEVVSEGIERFGGRAVVFVPGKH